jgi:cytochrome c
MPLTAPQSLSNDDVYAVSAYVLHLNGLLPDSAVVDGKALTALRMPNRDGFIGDPRPDVKNSDCMTNCTKAP